MEATLCSVVATPKTRLTTALVDLTTTCASATLASPEPNTIWKEIQRSESYVDVAIPTVDNTQLLTSKHAHFQICSNFKTLFGEHDRSSSLPRSRNGHSDRSDNDYAKILVRIQDSRSTLRRGGDPLLEEFCMSLDTRNATKNFLMPTSTKLFLAILNKLCFCCHSVGRRHSLYPSEMLYLSILTFQLALCWLSKSCYSHIFL